MGRLNHLERPLLFTCQQIDSSLQPLDNLVLTLHLHNHIYICPYLISYSYIGWNRLHWRLKFARFWCLFPFLRLSILKDLYLQSSSPREECALCFFFCLSCSQIYRTRSQKKRGKKKSQPLTVLLRLSENVSTLIQKN
jgi:hypothetical protein